jgi:hypothetical protein
VTREEHVARFDTEQRYVFAERSAIREYDGKTARPEADRLAYFETCRAFGLPACEDEHQLPLALGKKVG